MAFFNSSTRTSNPAFRQNTFIRASDTGAVMTLQGTVNKTGILLLLCAAAAAWTWNIARTQGNEAVQPWILSGFLGGFIVALIAIFVQKSTPFTAPIYAVLEGFALGGISSLFSETYHYIAIQAVAVTFGALALMLALYSAGILRATPKFVAGILIATGGVCLVYVVDMVLQLFGQAMPLIHASTPMGIGFSLVVVAIATLNLILDFGMIEQGVEQGAPKYMEWYGAFGIMVTLVWLYLEILRLLAKMSGNRQ